ncbi:FAD-binding oxidoreductase [uncultured Oxalicibacterium sp.]|uniref:FAD-binding oxidoreductase n=1 Tax=uncultured Oxalicibacterium sp. TaxID=1168540 RepID=UPI0025DAB4AB|nr:FAD-binding oxidoreductase [uncultured Oxalicibacterium sp.]
MNDFLAACRQAVGSTHLMTDTDALLPYQQEQRGRATGKALAVASPATTEEVARLVRLCHQYRVPIVAQGGNTGLVLGSIPDESGTALILSLRRLNRIREIDGVNNTMTVEAGCILQNVQQAAAGVGRLYPLSLASEGSCTIGGNLSANAGGTAVLRYGNSRELCLGLEVVTPQGDIWNGLRALRKDNTGYDLRDLYIGAEGTLGIITAAVLKLFPQPAAIRTTCVAVPSPHHALQLLNLAQQRCSAGLTGFELMSALCLTLVQRHFPEMTPLFSDIASPYYVLLELSDHESDTHATTLLENLIEEALQNGIASDAIVATSLTQSAALWQWRERIPPAQKSEGHNIKHDISLPISRIADFIAATDALIARHYSGARMVTFGHMGDGNLHYNVAAPAGEAPADFLKHQSAINRIVHDNVHAFDGSISAEHGIGTLKREEILRYKSPVEMQLMRSIKQALDPLNIMNPGKVL